MSAPVPVASVPAPPAAPASPLLIPGEKALFHAAKLAIELDKPILLDYYAGTQESGTAFLGQDKVTNEKVTSFPIDPRRFKKLTKQLETIGR